MTFTGTIRTSTRLERRDVHPDDNYSGAATLQIVTNDLGNTGTGGTLTDTDTVTINVNSLGIFTANQDIGAAGGSSTYAAGTYTVTGSGADIWGNADQFQYLYRTMTGDGRLTARVMSPTQTPHQQCPAKAGVMIRESPRRGQYARIDEHHGGERHRVPAGAPPRDGVGRVQYGRSSTAPYWVRITRVGERVTGERSRERHGVDHSRGRPDSHDGGDHLRRPCAMYAHETPLYTATFDNVALTTPPTAVADSYSPTRTPPSTSPPLRCAGQRHRPGEQRLDRGAGVGDTGLTFNANGSFTYVPPADFSGTASFTYKANDGVFDSNTVTVNLTVNPANEVPSFTKGANQSMARNAGAQSVAGWATAISQGTASPASWSTSSSPTTTTRCSARSPRSAPPAP